MMPRPRLTPTERAEWDWILADTYHRIDEALEEMGCPNIFEPDAEDEEEDDTGCVYTFL